jgi:telomerase reverse transcriptase
MFYARPALKATGVVRLGLRHIRKSILTYNKVDTDPRLPDVFNRFADTSSSEQTTHIAKYIFPREFKLHNVFTSPVDSRETSQPLKDYTLREHEITAVAAKTKSHLPKRIRGAPLALVHKIRTAHSKLPYVELLRHHCPDTVRPFSVDISTLTYSIVKDFK